MNRYTLFETPIGTCAIAWCGGQIVSTNLPEDSDEATAARIVRRAGAVESEAPEFILGVSARIRRLLSGERVDLTDIPCDFGEADEFQVKVYEATRAVPPGRTTTYGELAVKMGDRHLAQNVGRAMGANPIPIIVPCHRVLGANGKLTGFSAHGGVNTKLRMLAIEGAQIGEDPGLFDDLPTLLRPDE
ncbi:MAG: methylated-DNA--[protein]-cysteine S-methyltransferase [Pseudomonadota bacterium]